MQRHEIDVMNKQKNAQDEYASLLNNNALMMQSLLRQKQQRQQQIEVDVNALFDEIDVKLKQDEYICKILATYIEDFKKAIFLKCKKDYSSTSALACVKSLHRTIEVVLRESATIDEKFTVISKFETVARKNINKIDDKRKSKIIGIGAGVGVGVGVAAAMLTGALLGVFVAPFLLFFLMHLAIVGAIAGVLFGSAIGFGVSCKTKNLPEQLRAGSLRRDSFFKSSAQNLPALTPVKESIRLAAS